MILYGRQFPSQIPVGFSQTRYHGCTQPTNLCNNKTELNAEYAEYVQYGKYTKYAEYVKYDLVFCDLCTPLA